MKVDLNNPIKRIAAQSLQDFEAKEKRSLNIAAKKFIRQNKKSKFFINIGEKIAALNLKQYKKIFS